MKKVSPTEDHLAIAESRGRTNQKARTQRAIVEACVELIRQGQPVTMPEVAKAAMVSEATAYRYFPDLASLLAMALAADWPTPAEALAPVAASTIPSNAWPSPPASSSTESLSAKQWSGQ